MSNLAYKDQGLKQENLKLNKNPSKMIYNINKKLSSYEQNFYPYNDLNEDFFMYSFNEVLKKYGIEFNQTDLEGIVL